MPWRLSVVRWQVAAATREQWDDRCAQLLLPAPTVACAPPLPQIEDPTPNLQRVREKLEVEQARERCPWLLEQAKAVSVRELPCSARAVAVAPPPTHMPHSPRRRATAHLATLLAGRS